MTEISKKAIVKRWRELAKSDAGLWISEAAESIANFLEKFIGTGKRQNDGYEVFATNDVPADLMGWLFGFNATYQQFGTGCFSFWHTHGESNLVMHDFDLEEFEFFLQMQMPPKIRESTVMKWEEKHNFRWFMAEQKHRG